MRRVDCPEPGMFCALAGEIEEAAVPDDATLRAVRGERVEGALDPSAVDVIEERMLEDGAGLLLGTRVLRVLFTDVGSEGRDGAVGIGGVRSRSTRLRPLPVLQDRVGQRTRLRPSAPRCGEPPRVHRYPRG